MDTGNTGGSTDKDDLINLALVDSSILQHLLDGIKSARERLGVQIFKPSTGNLSVEVLSVKQRVDFNGGLGAVGESTLGTLASGSQTAECTGIARDICCI